MRIISSISLLLLLMVPVILHAQTTATQVIQKGNKTLVNVPVVVSDREGRRIPGLKKEDFSLFQNGERQNITSFSTENAPISVALLIDTSGSTQQVLNKIKDAAKDFIEQLNSNDQCLVATFDSKIDILIPFSSSQDELKKSLNKIRTAEREGTVMFNAINQIIQSSFKRVQGRKAIVLLSDGKDYGSVITRRDLVADLEESDVSIYAIHYQSGTGFTKPTIDPTGTVTETKPPKQEEVKLVKPPKPKKKVYTITIPTSGDTYTPEQVKLIDKATTTEAVESLKDLSDITAGRFYLSDDEKLSAVFKQVAAELRQQYLLSFYSEASNNNAVVQNISVKVDRPNVVVQARSKLRTN